MHPLGELSIFKYSMETRACAINQGSTHFFELQGGKYEFVCANDHFLKQEWRISVVRAE